VWCIGKAGISLSFGRPLGHRIKCIRPINPYLTALRTNISSI
jgi:hypothetical protein